MTILYAISDRIRSFLNRGHARSVKAKRNILLSLFTKGSNILLGFLLVPMTIGYVDKTQYGVWITLSSIVTWFRFFDVGLGNGLRNKFAESLAKDDHDLARTYVSTTYLILSGISLLVFLVFVVINPFLNWATILNTNAELSTQLSKVALVVFGFFSLNFVLKLINTVVTADQRPALVGVFNLITNAISVLIIFILTKTTEGSLLNLALALSGTPILVLGLASIFLFNRDYKIYRPGLKLVDFSYFKDIFSLGWQFFFIQVIGIIIFSTDNLIITQLYDPAEVTPYNVAFKYFGLITQGYTIISAPFWSAFTDAYNRQDFDWIKTSMRKLVWIWRMAVVGIVVLVAISKPFYALWVPSVEVPLTLSILMGLYVMLLTWGTPFVLFVNGVGKIRLQMIWSMVGGIANIPLSIFFAKYLGMGTPGIILATTACLSYGYIVAPIQYRKIMNNTATGIWNK